MKTIFEYFREEKVASTIGLGLVLLIATVFGRFQYMKFQEETELRIAKAAIYEKEQQLLEWAGDIAANHNSPWQGNIMGKDIPSWVAELVPDNPLGSIRAVKNLDGTSLHFGYDNGLMVLVFSPSNRTNGTIDVIKEHRL